MQEPSATPRLLRLIQRWVKEQARGGAAGGGADWMALSAESKDFLGEMILIFPALVLAGEGRR